MKDDLVIGIPRKIIRGNDPELLFAYTVVKISDGLNFNYSDEVLTNASRIAFLLDDNSRRGLETAGKMLHLLQKHEYISSYGKGSYIVSYGQFNEEKDFLSVTIGSFKKIREGCSNYKSVWAFYCTLLDRRTMDNYMVNSKSQLELAELSGLARSTVVRYMKILQDLGLIYVKNRVMTESGEYQTNIIGAAKDRAAIDRLYPGTKDVRNTRAAQSAAARYNQFVKRGPDKYSEEEVEEIEAETRKYNRLTKGKKLDTSVFEAAEPESDQANEAEVSEPEPIKEEDPFATYWRGREKRLAKLKAEEPEEPTAEFDWSKRRDDGSGLTQEELDDIFAEEPVAKPSGDSKPEPKSAPKIEIKPGPLIPYVDPDDPTGKVQMLPQSCLPRSHPDWAPDDEYFLAIAEAQANGYFDEEKDAREYDNDPWVKDFEDDTPPAVRALLDKACNTSAIDPPKEPSDFIKNTPFPEDVKRGPEESDPYVDVYVAE